MDDRQKLFEIVLHRTRNRIIDYLELMTSREKILDYQNKNRIANVYAELFDQWEDWVQLDENTLENSFPDPVFDNRERKAIDYYNTVWKKMLEKTPAQMDLGKFLATEEFGLMSYAAQKCFDIFDYRGRYEVESED